MVIEMPPTGDVIPVAQFYPTQIHRTYAALLEGDAPTGAAAADAYLEVTRAEETSVVAVVGSGAEAATTRAETNGRGGGGAVGA